MRKLTMTKLTVKAIFVLGIALSIFVSKPATTFAAECVHDFSECYREGTGYSSPELTHEYLYATDENGKEMYRTCEVTYHYQYCHYVCRFCNLRKSASERHAHVVGITHSVNHR